MTEPPFPDVSVLICVRNGAAYIAEAIDSAWQQQPPPSEVVVVDDGSTDASADIARRLGCRVVVTPPLGIGSARNTGFASVVNDHVLVLDADDVLVADALRVLTAATLASSHASGACGLQQPFVSPEIAGTAGIEASGPMTASALVSGGMWRRDAVSAVAFDTERPAADMDWVARLREQGRMVESVQQLVMMRRGHRTNTSLRPEVQADYLRVAHAAIRRRRGLAS